MKISRFAFISIAVLVVYQIDIAHGGLDPFSALTSLQPAIQPIIKPALSLLDSLPFNLRPVVRTLLTIVNLDNYPNLDTDIENYKTRDTKPKCCLPQQYPDLFRFLYDFFSALETIGKKFTSFICDLLQYVSPLTCQKNIRENVIKNQANNVTDIPSLGCFVDSLLGTFFGKVGIFCGTVMVGVVGSLDYMDGCLITGVAQVFNYAAFKTPNPTMGDASGPIAVLSTILGFIFSTMYCLGAPFDRYIGDAYKWSCEMILDKCEVEYEKGLWYDYDDYFK